MAGFPLMGSALYFLPMLYRSQVVVSDNLRFAPPTEDGQTYPLVVSFDRHRTEKAGWSYGSGAGRWQSSEREILSLERRQSDEFKRIVNVWTVGVKPSRDAVMATPLEYRRGDILREGFDQPCSTANKTAPVGAPDYAI